MEDKAESYKTGDLLKKYTWNIDKSEPYPKKKECLLLNKSFFQLKEQTREGYKQHYDIIISNENQRELIFHGVECILSPKQFHMVFYLLQYGVFHNTNFSQKTYTEEGLENNSEIFSDSKSEISNTKNKIKRKIKTQMKKQKIVLPEFDKKFEDFIKIDPLNYSLTYPNEYTSVKTLYRIKLRLSRVKKQKC